MWHSFHNNIHVYNWLIVVALYYLYECQGVGVGGISGTRS